MSSSPYDVPALLEKISTNGKNIGKDSGEAQRQCLEAARTLVFALEPPIQVLCRYAWAEQTILAAIHTCIDLNVFSILDGEGGKRKTNDELAASTGADPEVMAILLKHLAAMGIIYEASANEYLPTPVSHILSMPMHQAAILSMYGDFGAAFHAIPSFLAKTGYKYPKNPENAPIQQAYNTKEKFFDYMGEVPDRVTRFQMHMAGKSKIAHNFMHDADFVRTVLIQGAKTDHDAVTLVDIGGGAGHDAQVLSQKYPDLPGKIVLEDLEGPLAKAKSANLNKNIVLLKHDFFTEQPIKGARVYLFNNVLQDWPDNIAIEMLKHVAPAMERGYSKLLINERFTPPQGAHHLTTGLNVLLMALLANKERSVDDWYRILPAAGLKLKNIWNFDPAGESLLEAELA